jgi:TfoX/Sxy family transcriptional regulator of competence genes
MAYDRGLAERIRELLAQEPGYAERKMFGGIGFLLHGNMACGVIKDALIVRVGLPDYEAMLALPDTRVFDITGRAMKGWIMVSGAGYEDDEDLSRWVRRGTAFSLTLPPK